MPTLQFMPWCPIDKKYKVGEITIIPFNRDEKMEDLDEFSSCQIRTILKVYKDLEGHPVKKVALVKYGDNEITADIDNDQRETTRELVQIACFCGLANRNYFKRSGKECNSDCFTFYIQEFKDDPIRATFVTRQRVGVAKDHRRSLDETIFTIPLHTSGIGSISLDEKLLTALIKFRDSTSETDWSRWLNAISCFNQANTNNYSVLYQTEWVLLCSAFEHLLDAKSNAKDVARKFSEILTFCRPLSKNDWKRNSSKLKESNESLRYEWMREFYKIRGNFAHGKLKIKREIAWTRLEHLVLATIAFPLVIHKLLAKKDDYYSLTEDDKCQIEIFERLANEKFLEDPPNQEEGGDSWWEHLMKECSFENMRNRASEMFDTKMNS